MSRRNRIILGTVLGAVVLAAIVAVLLLAGKNSGRSSGSVYTVPRNKNHVEEFYNRLISKHGDKGFFKDPGITNCFNVTPAGITRKTGARIFAVCNNEYYYQEANYLMIDGEIYDLGSASGGYGFEDAVPWDYDDNGVKDILFTYSCGSGIHQSFISVFDLSEMEEITIYRFIGGEFLLSAGKKGTLDVYRAGILNEEYYETGILNFKIDGLFGRIESSENGPVCIQKKTEDYLNRLHQDGGWKRYDRILSDINDGTVIKRLKEMGFDEVETDIRWRGSSIGSVFIWMKRVRASFYVYVYEDHVNISKYEDGSSNEDELSYDNDNATDAEFFYDLIAEHLC